MRNKRISINHSFHFLSMFFPPLYTGTDEFDDFMSDLLNRGQVLNQEDPKTYYLVQAFINDVLQWEEYALDDVERNNLVHQAVQAGFTYTVETEVQ